jgi:hypothetical protein
MPDTWDTNWHYSQNGLHHEMCFNAHATCFHVSSIVSILLGRQLIGVDKSLEFDPVRCMDHLQLSLDLLTIAVSQH